MVQQVDKQGALEKLVDELMKDQPRPQIVRKLTTELGIVYSLDPVTQMSTVLQSMNAVPPRNNKRKDVER